MNIDQFHQYLRSPDQLNSESLTELDDLVKEYPYFQAARMLLVMNLKNEEDIRFNRQLKFAAACVNNRQLLFGLLNRIRITEDGSFFPEEIEKQDEISVSGTEIVAGNKYEDEPKNGDLLSLNEDGITASIPSDEQVSGRDKSLYVKELERFIPVADLDLLIFDFPITSDPEILDFDFKNELPEIAGEITVEEKDQEKKPEGRASISSIDLIDDFIRKNPRMPQPADTLHGTSDISLESLKESDAFMTETLAEIYMKQGYYYRALQAYEKLSLKYPQKSIYFASQIQKIKDLITNQ